MGGARLRIRRRGSVTRIHLRFLAFLKSWCMVMLLLAITCLTVFLFHRELVILRVPRGCSWDTPSRRWNKRYGLPTTPMCQALRLCMQQMTPFSVGLDVAQSSATHLRATMCLLQLTKEFC